MAFHPVPLTVELKLHGDHEGDPRITVLHYRYGPAGGPNPTVAELQGMIDTVKTTVLPALAAIVHSTTRWTAISALDIDHFGANYAEQTLDPVVNGAGGGDVNPGNVQLVLAKKSSLAARRGRGRLFIPDLPEGFVNDAIITPTLQALALALGSNLLRSQGTSRVFVPVVASKKYVMFNALIAVVFDLITDSLRTRLKFHRRVRRRRTT